MKINKRDFLFCVRIDLSKELETTEEAWIDLREPDTQFLMRYRQFALEKNEEKLVSYLLEKLPEYILGHSFYKEDGAPYSNIELVELLTSRGNFFVNDIFVKLIDSPFFQPEKKKQKK